MFILDTNVVSELRKLGSGRIDPRVARWASETVRETLYLSAISILELEVGILLIERRDAAQAALLRKWMNNQVMPEFEHRIIPVDTKIAQRCAQLHVPDRRGERDALIAATALVHGMTVVTRNLADFRAAGVPLLNPWEAAA